MKYFFLLLFSLTTYAAYACECNRKMEQELKNATAIFEGIPFSRKYNEERYTDTYQFKVTKVWKGEAADTIALEVDSPEHSSCGEYFHLNREHIIFTYGNTTHLCTFNQYLAHANILGVLRYSFEEGFREKLGQKNRKRLNKQEAFYLNNKFRDERGRLDFHEARVIFRNRKRRIRKKAYFDQWGNTMYQETLIVIHPKKRWLRGYDAVIITGPPWD